MFAALPWIARFSLRLRAMGPAAMPWLLGAFLLGAFLKLSFVLCAAALLVTIVLDGARRGEAHPWTIGELFGKRGRVHVLFAVVTFAVFYAIVHVAYVARGWTAIQVPVTLRAPLTGITYAFAAPVTSALSLAHTLEFALRSVSLDFPTRCLAAACICAPPAALIHVAPAPHDARIAVWRPPFGGLLLVHVVVFAWLFVTGTGSPTKSGLSAAGLCCSRVIPR